MKIIILGGDGYLGYSLAQYLKARDCFVVGLDNLSRRRLVRKHGGTSLILDKPLFDKQEIFDDFYLGDLVDHVEALVTTHPDADAIVHLAEQPSAPYSMIGPQEACETIRNNVEGTMKLLFSIRDYIPNVHLVKLGTMGEYGTPKIPIYEGRLPVELDGHKDLLPYPKQPGSIYHASKVMDSTLIEMLCRIWDIRCTDIMQGVVYGVALDENIDNPELWTRFDYDDIFGTAINRFVAQALVGYPLTVYGSGGQARGFLDIRDSMDCLWLTIQNPPQEGEYRVFNQLANTHKLGDLATIVSSVAKEHFEIDVGIKRIENPRVEAEAHFYEVKTDNLRNLGYKPRDLLEGIELLFRCLLPFKSNVNKSVIIPKVLWKGDNDELAKDIGVAI